LYIKNEGGTTMRLGGGIVKEYKNPEQWISLVKELGYSAVISPINSGASKEEIAAYKDIAKQNDVTIAEVGAWSNPISPDDETRKKALQYIKNQLAFADEIGALCCVNICGSRGEVWDGFYSDNYTEETYALIIDSVREIIDTVKPVNTFYTLEPMPWMHPDSPEDYLQMIKDVDRPAFAVHLDYANMINSVERYKNITAFITHCYKLLGPYIKSIHAKDVLLANFKLPCNINEVAPGQGIIDHGVVLRLTQELSDDMPLMTEHLSTHEQYYDAAAFIRKIGEQEGINIKTTY
jgi:sugar phosphate isomerase/epimerase